MLGIDEIDQQILYFADIQVIITLLQSNEKIRNVVIKNISSIFNNVDQSLCLSDLDDLVFLITILISFNEFEICKLLIKRIYT
jgi:hypothetical protein